MARGSQVNLFGVGVNGTAKSLNVTASSRRNLYYDIQPAPGDKSMISVMNTPGATAVSDFFGSSMPAATCKTAYTTADGARVFAVYGTDLYQNSYGSHGALSPNTSNPEISDNGDHIVIACGDRLYRKPHAIGGAPVRTYFDSGSSYDIPALSVTFLDGYFIAAVNSSVNNADGVYVSSLYDGSKWAILDYAKAESNPELTIKVIAANGLLYVFGEYSTEVWQNVGDPNYPFQPIQGAKYTYGLQASKCIKNINGVLYGYFRNQNGEYGIYRINGLQFEKISTPDMSGFLNYLNNINQTTHKSITYSIGGHNFYQITFAPSGSPLYSYLYDDVSETWTNTTSGTLGYHIGGCSFAYGGEQYITDIRTNNNKVYTLSQSVYQDDGVTNSRVLVGNHIFLPDRGTFRLNSISLDMEHGAGALTVYLRLSRDGGHSFGEAYSDTSNSLQYSRFFQFNRLGKGRDIVPAIESNSDCKFVLIGAVAEIAPFGW